MCIMKLSSYMKTLDSNGKRDFAASVGTTVSNLTQIAGGHTLAGPKLCVRIEQRSFGAVTRPELRDDWAEIWPELKRKAKP